MGGTIIIRRRGEARVVSYSINIMLFILWSILTILAVVSAFVDFVDIFITFNGDFSIVVLIQLVEGIELGRQIGRGFYHVLPSLTSVDQPKGYDHSPGGFLRAELRAERARATDLGRTGILRGAQDDQFHL